MKVTLDPESIKTTVLTLAALLFFPERTLQMSVWIEIAPFCEILNEF
jgi:hypothetical protein